jgi:hypothetical protein
MRTHTVIARIQSALVTGVMCLNWSQSVIRRQIQLNNRVFENVHQRYAQYFCRTSTRYTASQLRF